MSQTTPGPSFISPASDERAKCGPCSGSGKRHSIFDTCSCEPECEGLGKCCACEGSGFSPASPVSEGREAADCDDCAATQAERGRLSFEVEDLRVALSEAQRERDEALTREAALRESLVEAEPILAEEGHVNAALRARNALERTPEEIVRVFDARIGMWKRAAMEIDEQRKDAEASLASERTAREKAEQSLVEARNALEAVGYALDGDDDSHIDHYPMARRVVDLVAAREKAERERDEVVSSRAHVYGQWEQEVAARESAEARVKEAREHIRILIDLHDEGACGVDLGTQRLAARELLASLSETEPQDKDAHGIREGSNPASNGGTHGGDHPRVAEAIRAAKEDLRGALRVAEQRESAALADADELRADLASEKAGSSQKTVLIDFYKGAFDRERDRCRLVLETAEQWLSKGEVEQALGTLRFALRTLDWEQKPDCAERINDAQRCALEKGHAGICLAGSAPSALAALSPSEPKPRKTIQQLNAEWLPTATPEARKAYESEPKPREEDCLCEEPCGFDVCPTRDALRPSSPKGGA